MARKHNLLVNDYIIFIYVFTHAPDFFGIGVVDIKLCTWIALELDMNSISLFLFQIVWTWIRL